MAAKKLIIIVLTVIILLSNYTFHIPAAKADSEVTAALRILSTGDLHGQVTALNYETGQKEPVNGLSKLATLTGQKEKEAGANNTLLVDAGDFLYDYSSNFFYDNYRDTLQPVMKAMSIMDYDFITLGNHEFDYPWDYLSSQLKESELYDKVLLCNAVWHDSGKPVFAPSTIITKYLTTSEYKAVPVRIGIIGSTTNSISTRRGDYVNEIEAVNNYDSILAEADRLKNVEKADVVIVILHGGIGTSDPGQESDNIGYALTKVNSIDAVITGHSHDTFPDSKKESLLNLPAGSVDSSTGRINGKPVVAASSHANALGTIDLTFAVASDGAVTITGGSSHIDFVTEQTEEDRRITTMFQDYGKKLESGADLHTYKISKGITYHNYDTVVQDSNLYQLFNNAKIAYGLTYQAEYLPEYKNIPVIACTRNLLDQDDPYINIKDSFSAAKTAQILSESSSSRPSGYLQMYVITGKSLKEWLEYNASIYAVQGTAFKNILKPYVSKNPGVSTLLQEYNVYNWNSQYVFDGISYSIDLSKKARYSSSGVRLNSDYRRITNLTYNGAAITDSQKFILVTDSGIPALSFLPKEGEDSIKVIKDNATGKNVTLDYIRKLSAFGSITLTADHNWSLTALKNYTFLLGVPKSIAAATAVFSWSSGSAAETTSYSFLKGKLPAVTQSINIVAAQGRTEVNNDPVPVILSATSKYAIKEIRYLPGKVSSTSDTGWKDAPAVQSSTFTVTRNGVYTILAADKNNNRSLAYITVDRYDPDILPSPVLNKLTNRNSEITGKAVPNSMIQIAIGDDRYNGTVNSNGSFRINVKPPKAFSPITAYVTAGARKSAIAKAAVRKTGPDAVTINTVKIMDTSITGTADADTFVYALIWSTVYVGKGQTEAYRNSDFYNSTYKISETDISVDPITGAYKIQVPSLKWNMKVFVFSVDRFGATSKSTQAVPVNY